MNDASSVRLGGKLLGVLGVLMEDPNRRTYGFELMTQAGIKSGTMYPILARLEREGLLQSEWEEGDPGDLGRPRRRYYKLTAAGCVFAGDAMREGARREGSKQRRPLPLIPSPS